MVSKSQIEKISQEMPHAMQIKIMQRYLSDKEIRQLLEAYSKASFIGRNRFAYLEKPVTEQELRLLADYLDTSKKADDIIEIHKISKSGIGAKVARIALRLYHQKYAK